MKYTYTVSQHVEGLDYEKQNKFPKAEVGVVLSKNGVVLQGLWEWEFHSKNGVVLTKWMVLQKLSYELWHPP